MAVVLLGAGLLGVTVVSNPSETASEALGETAGEAVAPAGQAAAALAEGAPLPAAEPPPVPAADAPPAAPAVAEKAYTGRSAGDEVTVAVAVKDGKAVGYVCDGEKVEAWLEGTLTGETLALSGKTGTVTGTLDDQAAFGTVVVDGAEWPFSARGVAAPAGLYERRGLPARGGGSGGVDRRGRRHGHRRADRGRGVEQGAGAGPGGARMRRRSRVARWR